MKKENTIIKMLALGAIFSAMLTSCKVSKKETTNNNAWTRPKTTVTTPTTTDTTTTTTIPEVAGFSLITNETTDEVLGKCLSVSEIKFTSGKTLPHVTIPDDINGVPVTKVTIYSNERYKMIPMISLGKNVKEIYGSINTNITAVQLDSENQYFTLIDDIIYTKDGKKLVFAPALETVTISRGAEEIGKYSMYGIAATSLNIPGNIKKVDSYAFSSKVTNITLNEGLETIETYAFGYCKVTDITIPASVTKVDCQNFGYAQKITVAAGNTVYDSRNNCNMIIETATNKTICAAANFSIPSTVEEIGRYTFSYRYGVTSVTLPATIKKIGYGAFQYCYDLQSLKILNKDVEMEQYIISGCYKLEKFAYPSTFTNYTYSPFNDCQSLKQAVLPKIDKISNNAFSKCKSIEEIYFGESKETMETKFPDLGKDEEYYQNAKKYYYVSTKAEVDSATYDAWTYTSDGGIYTKNGTIYIG